jgi:hypothetical protein
MKRSIFITTFAIFIALYLGLLSVYGQEGEQRRRAGTQQPGSGIDVGMARLLMRLMDLDNDGKLSGGEYMKFFVDADQDKDGSITQKEMMELMSKIRRETREQNQETGGPSVGQMAPDFTLRTLDGDRTVKLSDFRGKKPVVLVFGSYT